MTPRSAKWGADRARDAKMDSESESSYISVRSAMSDDMQVEPAPLDRGRATTKART